MVELKPFNDHALNGDLETLRGKVAKVQPRLPGGRSLFFHIQGVAVILFQMRRRRQWRETRIDNRFHWSERQRGL